MSGERIIEYPNRQYPHLSKEDVQHYSRAKEYIEFLYVSDLITHAQTEIIKNRLRCKMEQQEADYMRKELNNTTQRNYYVTQSHIPSLIGGILI